MKNSKLREYKRYLVWIDNLSDGWELHTQTDDFNEAVKWREFTLHNGWDTIITEYIPIVSVDGRKEKHGEAQP